MNGFYRKYSRCSGWNDIRKELTVILDFECRLVCSARSVYFTNVSAVVVKVPGVTCCWKSYPLH